MMHEKQKSFKRPPRKFIPKGIEILYEDRDILVVEKINGLLTVGTEISKENNVLFLLNHYVGKGNPKSPNRVYIVHRLDKETSGILVFAKNEEARTALKKNWSDTPQHYLAVVSGHMKDKEGHVSSYLLENSMHRMYSVAYSKEGKISKTAYRVVKEAEHFSLLDIDLLTGRKDQIRVHMADLGCPVAGDKKYGIKGQGVKRLCLHAAALTIIHPHTNESMTFESQIPPYFHNVMNKKLESAKDAKAVDSAPPVPPRPATKEPDSKKPKKKQRHKPRSGQPAGKYREKAQRRGES